MECFGQVGHESWLCGGCRGENQGTIASLSTKSGSASHPLLGAFPPNEGGYINLICGLILIYDSNGLIFMVRLSTVGIHTPSRFLPL